MSIRCVGPSRYSPLRVVHPPRQIDPDAPIDGGTVIAAYVVMACCGGGVVLLAMTVWGWL